MKSEQFLASLLSGQYINTIKKPEQWEPVLFHCQATVSKAGAGIPDVPFVSRDWVFQDGNFAKQLG